MGKSSRPSSRTHSSAKRGAASHAARGEDNVDAMDASSERAGAREGTSPQAVPLSAHGAEEGPADAPPVRVGCCKP